MGSRLKLGDITVDVVKKDIRNIHLSVYPPTGRARISAPSRMTDDAIRGFAISRLGWIRKQQKKMLDQERETPREYLDRESHYIWGERCLLKVVEEDRASSVSLNHKTMILRVRPGSDQAKREEVLHAWYRAQLKAAVPELIVRWEEKIGVSVREFGIKKMKTRWGTCNPEARRIWLNLELAKKPVTCLEYIVVHEMIHFIERRHNTRFISLMDTFLPQWRTYRDQLNRLPVRHEDWRY